MKFPSDLGDDACGEWRYRTHNNLHRWFDWLTMSGVAVVEPSP